MATQAELQQKIDALPQAVADAVVAAVKPLITAPVDTQPQIDALDGVPQHVADLVATALQNPAP